MGLATILIFSVLTPLPNRSYGEHLTVNTLNMSESPGVISDNPRIAVSGDRIYAIWKENVGNGDIFFKRSLDGGSTFGDVVNLSNTAGASDDPQIVAVGSNVLIAWRELAGGNNEIFFRQSSNNGTTFGDSINVSNNSGQSFFPQLAVSGNDVYVVWQDSGGLGGTLDIFFKRSTDNGATFSEPTINVSNNTAVSSFPKIAAWEDNLYVVWQDSGGLSTTNDIFFKRSTDNGATFSEPTINVSNNTGSSRLPQVAASGSNVYATWQDSSSGESGILFKRSVNQGQTFSEPTKTLSADGDGAAAPEISANGTNVYVVWDTSISGADDVLFQASSDEGVNFYDSRIDLSNNDGNSVLPRLGVLGNDAYVVWHDSSIKGPGLDEVLSVAVSDGGTNIGCPINLSNSDGASVIPRIAISDTGNVFIVWKESTEDSAGDIIFASNPDFESKRLTLDHVIVSDSGGNLLEQPRWGLDTVAILGSVANPGSGDKALVNWGDGSPIEETTISGCSWDQLTHTYLSEAIGTNTISVNMTDSSGSTIFDTASYSIEVQKHQTSLTIAGLDSVVAGDPILVSGVLTDAETGDPIEGADITFDGTGAGSLNDSSTASDGGFSSTGASPGLSDSEGLTVQASFSGDSQYAESSSNIISYDTAAPTAVEIPITDLGPNSIDLGASPYNFTGWKLDIDDVSELGSILVAACSAPDSDRYIALDNKCIKISSAFGITEGSAVHIHMTLINVTLPTGASANDVDMFVASGGSVADITEERTDNVLSGKTSTFGKYVGGIALHVGKPANSVRQQLFLSASTEVHFRDYTNTDPARAVISLDKSKYVVGNTATITISDAERNLDASARNTIAAFVSSNSDSEGIQVTLTETGPNSGTFQGTVKLASTSSPAKGLLKVAAGDTLTVHYHPSGPRMKVTIDGMSESGLIEISDTAVNRDLVAFEPVIDAAQIKLVDAQLGSDGFVTLIMSYANAPIDESGLIFGSDQAELRMYRSDDPNTGVWEDITSEVDTTGKTVTGQAPSIGTFMLGFDVPNPGGCSGGCALPGTGVVLDFAVGIAKAASTESSGGGGHHGGGGGGGTISGSIQLPAGQDVETAARIGSETVVLSFESLESGGQVRVDLRNIFSLTGIFDKISEDGKHGILVLEGTRFSTVGTIFDIDGTRVDFKGFVKITIPYDQAEVKDEDESNVRMLHYDDKTQRWSDITVDFNSNENTVTGMTNSLSPVVAAVVDDGTFPQIYFESNPLGKVVTEPKISTDAKVNENLSISTVIKNVQRTDQNYTFIVQVLDSDNIVQWISWQQGTVARGQNLNLSGIWIPENEGKYTIQIFMWDGIDKPSPLSNATEMKVTVTGFAHNSEQQ